MTYPEAIVYSAFIFGVSYFLSSNSRYSITLGFDWNTQKLITKIIDKK